MSNRKPLLAGNWKLNKKVGEAVELVEGLKKNLKDVTDREILVCPVFTSLSEVSKALKGSNIALGGQNLYWEAKGAFTGEVSGQLLVDCGCKYVIVGHSERRQFFGETDETVNKRIKAAFASNLVPIACIGETLKERESNITFKVIDTQVKNGLAGLSKEQANTIVIAYEPVWAIGTGKTATPAQAQEVHAYIRKIYGEMYGKEAADKVRILYGGSVKADNAKELMGQADIDGALVGGASLEVESFTKIVKY